jgi:hypothetical protein
MGVLVIMISEIRIGAVMFVRVRNLVVNATPGAWGAEWEE